MPARSILRTMQRSNNFLLYCILICFLSVVSARTYAQSDSLQESLPTDSLISRNDIQYFLKNPSTWIQNNIYILNSLTLPTKSAVDTTLLQSKLERIANSGELIKENLKDESGSYRLRYIIEYSNELQTDLNEMIALQNTLQKQNNGLSGQTLVVSRIQNETAYFNDHATPSIKAIYQNEIASLQAAIQKTNELLSERLSRLVRLESSVNTVTFQLQENSKYAESLIHEKRRSLFKANYPSIWKTTPKDYPSPFLQTIQETITRSKENILFYLDHGKIFSVLVRIAFILFVLLTFYHFYNSDKIEFSRSNPEKYLHKYPREATLLLFLSLLPFTFHHAPFLLIDLLFFLQTLVVALIYYKVNRSLPMRSFYILIACILLLKFINTLITPTFVGRVIMTAAILMILPMLFLYRDYIAKNRENRVARILFVILLLQLSLGWILTLFGYFLLGRSYFIGAINAFILVFILYITVYTAIDYLRLITKWINKQLKSLYLNEEVVIKYLGNLLIGLAALIFLLAYTINLNIYDFLATYLFNLLNEPRQLGDSTFTYSRILQFLAYFLGAILLANFFNKLIDTSDNKKHIKRRTSLGSFMLLFRFTLISIGFILAILASGIPLTQITVLMGALGVGIGFGLQSIFNNMISGLVIAIEKPISVGDMIEVDNNLGWVKGIGIRSSNIQSFDGAEVIIPNGELVSNKVTNWTLSDKTRRLDIQIGVAYKSDPREVYSILMQVVTDHPEVLKSREPFIIFTGLGESSLDFKIYFWISDILEGMRIRSELLFKIFETLRENKIEIPFPQRDLHLKLDETEVKIDRIPRSKDQTE